MSHAFFCVSCPVQHATSVFWWSDSALAVSDLSGCVGVARLPGFSNMLGLPGEGLARFAPGVCVCVIAFTLNGHSLTRVS